MTKELSCPWNDMVPKIDIGRCQRCADCPPVAACLARALCREGSGSIPFADGDLCFACYSCVGACPFGAIVAPRMH
jgi:Fe-S-cluster-containing hydrogenase component 2